MLIICPKCQFEQPEDVYCAKCGVHIPSFHAPEEPIPQKALRSGSFYVFLFACLAIGSGLYFYNNWNKYDRDGNKYALEDLKSWLLNEPVIEDDYLEEEELEPTQEVAEAESMALNSAPTETQTKDAIPTESTAQINIQNDKIDISFYEVGNEDLAKYAELFDIKFQSEESMSFTSNQELIVKELLQNARRIGSKQYPLAENNLRRFEEVDENKKVLYFAYDLAWESLNESKTQLIGSITLYFQDLNTKVNENSEVLELRQNFALEKGQYLFIKGFIPQGVVSQEEKVNYTNTADILNIYSSDSYENSITDFVSIIHIPHSTAP